MSLDPSPNDMDGFIDNLCDRFEAAWQGETPYAAATLALGPGDANSYPGTTAPMQG